jgi:predicted ArsR family transcriptional regulator
MIRPPRGRHGSPAAAPREDIVRRRLDRLADAVGGPTRRALLTLVTFQGPLDARAAGAALGISPATARQQLQMLRRCGFLCQVDPSPHHHAASPARYRLSPLGAELIDWLDR